MYGHLTVICGPMYAGKTTEILKRIIVARNLWSKAVLVVKPALDDRYSATKIVSHDKLATEAKAITSWDQIDLLAADADMVCIDEVQFFQEPHFHGDVVEQVRQLLATGTDVVVSGLDMDWQGEPFNVTARLIAMADEVKKLQANCTVCAQPAPKTHKKSPNGEQIEVGAGDLYEARCNTHWGL
jgi:thymidine kinase